ncbi:hypothetical protein DFH06DRAFT_1150681 [Mycena polygramma]|nr:hypothetical protein DFH06DRAFT_1150681 [Mycena polygramma]
MASFIFFHLSCALKCMTFHLPLVAHGVTLDVLSQICSYLAIVSRPETKRQDWTPHWVAINSGRHTDSQSRLKIRESVRGPARARTAYATVVVFRHVIAVARWFQRYRSWLQPNSPLEPMKSVQPSNSRPQNSTLDRHQPFGVNGPLVAQTVDSTPRSKQVTVKLGVARTLILPRGFFVAAWPQMV